MIAKSWFDRCWQWQIGGSLAIFGTLLVGGGEIANAQIVPDNTLGAESSVVTPKVNIRGIPSDRIDGGAIRGANLFHSFEQLSVLQGRGAYFTNPAGIENILSRVTGANRSDILGRLGVLGPANLFLINPNGIVFGPSASLDVQGSFLATTANAVKLGDTGLFSASQPSSSNLLSVSPSALWFNAVAAQPIVNRSQAPSLIDQLNSGDLPPGLQVQPGRTLALVGGDVLLDSGRLTAAGGRIELGSVARVGEVSLSSSGNNFVLGYDSINNFGNITLSNGAFVNASGEGGGDVQIRGGRFSMTQSSNIWANTFGAENGKEVLVRATEVELSEDSYLRANVTDTGTGTGGDIRIDTGRLLVRDGAYISTDTFGSGNGGSLQISAADSVEVIGTSARGQFIGGLFAGSQGSGDAGNLSINTGRLLVRGGAQVSTGPFGPGKGGSLQITATDSVEAIGTSANGQSPSGLFTNSQGSGDAGNLRINTGRLLVRDGAVVSAATFGSGKGGSLQISAADSVEVVRTSASGQSTTGLFTSSVGSGDAGDLRIDTGRLLVRDGTQVSTTTYGSGKGGSLQIMAADSVEVIGTSTNGQFVSGLSTESQGSGDAGDIRIDAGRLLVRDGARVSAGTFGSGKGGSLQIKASDSVEVIGTSANGQSPSGLSAQSNDNGSGDAGDLRIDTRRLLVRDGAQVSTGTFAPGKGGSLQITATDSVEVIGTSASDSGGSRLSTSSEGSAGPGDLSINTRRLLVSDGAVVSASSFSSGKGGSLQITATDSVEVIGRSASDSGGSRLSASSFFGSAGPGDLSINTRRLLVSDGGEVAVDTFAPGKGGSLQITATDSVEATGRSADGQFPSGLFARNTNSASGDGGDVRINTRRLLVSDGAELSVDAFGSGSGGSLQITATDSVEVIRGESTANGFNSSGLFARNSNYSGSGDAGILRIDTGRLLVRDGGQVSAITRGSGKGGSLQINASERVEVIGTSANGQSPSGLLAQSYGSGDAGDLSINTRRLLVRDGAEVSAATRRGSGKGGSLQITASDWVALIGRSVDGQLASGLFTDSQGSGDAGNLSINTGRLLVRDGAQVQSGTVSEGNGGSLQIAATDSVEVSGRSADGRFGSRLLADSQGSGNAGDLSINTGRLLVRDGARVSTATSGQGKGGSLQINASDWVALIGSSANGRGVSRLSASSEGSGDAGDLRIDTGRLLVRDGAQVSAGTRNSGNGGNLQITAADSVEVSGRSADGSLPSGLFTPSEGSGDAGDLRIDTGRLLVRDGAQVSSYSTREGTAGNINITARDTLQANNGRISTTSARSSGGSIDIKASNIRLSGNSDITSSVNSGAGGGGNIDIKADSILAFDDSDILAFARNGRGGNITLDTPVFFGESYHPAPRNTNPATLDRNNRVDINATGNLASGNIALPNTTSIQNSLTELPENRIDTDRLLASSCIVRRSRPTRGSFTVTGTGGLPQRPGDVQMSDFPTVDVETLPSDATSSNRSWQKGDPIVEPQGVYRLPNGKLVMSRECY
ncbi:filamentous hemagglutinin N-terminal domain-containing protein [Microcoleus sp. T3_A4]|uniref:two-partner secretion domain-containing protein n=1 Tax=Microcoleus sp. T3_A4 TaxID=2818968 RepID=UPI002FD6EB3A